MGSSDPNTTLRLVLITLFCLIVPALFIGGVLPWSWLPGSHPGLPALIIVGCVSLVVLARRLLSK